MRAWETCRRCPLHAGRKHVVLYRGDTHPDVLFIGEAPGRSEDTLAKPFIGPSGKLAEEMIAEAIEMSGVDFSYGWANILGCIPWADPDNPNSGVRPPQEEEVDACWERLLTTIRSYKPRALVYIGKTASTREKRLKKSLGPDLPPHSLALQHPAYLLRNGGRACVHGARWVSDLSHFLSTNL